jgi:hypothetical protein
VKNVAPLRHHRGGSILEVGSGGKNIFSLHQISKRHIEATSLSESSQEEVEDNREKWGDFWEKLIAI